MRNRTFMGLVLAGVAVASCARSGEVGPPIQVAPDRCPPNAPDQETAPWTDWERVRLPNGRMLELRGCRSEGEAWVEFEYRGATPAPGLHLVQYRLYEGGGWMVLDATTGQVQPVSGEPVFSPERRWFATGMVDLAAQYNRNHLDVWRVEGDSIRRVLKMDGDGEWGAADLRWAAPDTLRYLRISRAEGAGGPLALDSTRMRVVRRGAAWEAERGGEP